MALLFFILGLLLFIALIVFHEWGHYLVARRNGIDVEEFGIGFPPRAFKRRLKNGTLFSINWLPLGGFVKLKGEHDNDTEPNSYGAASLKTKVKVMLAGVLMNLATAILMFTFVALIGMPKIIDNQFTVASDTKIIQETDNKGDIRVGRVVENSPAARAGIKKDDQIISVNNKVIDKPEELSEATQLYAGQQVKVEIGKYIKIDDDDFYFSRYTKNIVLNKTSPYLGVAPYSAETGFEVRRSTWSAPIVALGVARDFTIETFKGLGTVLKGLGSTIAGFFTGNKEARQAGQEKATDQVSGPVGIFNALYKISRMGFVLVLFIVAVISLTLAIMNALPIPPLDGGRLFLTLLYRARRKKLTPAVEERVNAAGFGFFILLTIIITVVDIKRL